MDSLELRDPVYFEEEHRMVRDQLRRFVESEVIPNGEQWE